MKPLLSIIIVSWNVREQLEANLARLETLRDEVPFEVFVVDNASSDGSAAMVHTRFPWVHLLAFDWNAGFAYACNQALTRAVGACFVLLNPDMLVNPGTLRETYACLSGDASIGVLGVRLEQGGEVIRSVRRDPGFWDQLAIMLKVPHVFPRVQAVARYRADDMDYDRSQIVEQVRGSYFAFRRDVWLAVGALDERFFIWFEEVDYCLRVRDVGYTVYYRADLSCEDYVGRSFAQVRLARKQRLFTRSLAQFMQKQYGWWRALPFWLLRPLVIGLAWLADGWKTLRS